MSNSHGSDQSWSLIEREKRIDELNEVDFASVYICFFSFYTYFTSLFCSLPRPPSPPSSARFIDPKWVVSVKWSCVFKPRVLRPVCIGIDNDVWTCWESRFKSSTYASIRTTNIGFAFGGIVLSLLILGHCLHNHSKLQRMFRLFRWIVWYSLGKSSSVPVLLCLNHYMLQHFLSSESKKMKDYSLWDGRYIYACKKKCLIKDNDCSFVTRKFKCNDSDINSKTNSSLPHPRTTIIINVRGRRIHYIQTCRGKEKSWRNSIFSTSGSFYIPSESAKDDLISLQITNLTSLEWMERCWGRGQKTKNSSGHDLFGFQKAITHERRKWYSSSCSTR